MNITLLGSCRIDLPSNNLNNLLSYVHSTKEILQLIDFVNGNLEVPDDVAKCLFRTAILKDSVIRYDRKIKQAFDRSDTVLVEICCQMNYVYDGYYLHLLAANAHFEYHKKTPKYIFDNVRQVIQSDEEIEADIKQIVAKLKGKRVFFVCHYDAIVNGAPIPKRHHLIRLLERVCAENNYEFINPREMLTEFSQEDFTDDFNHYHEPARQALFAKILARISENSPSPSGAWQKIYEALCQRRAWDWLAVRTERRARNSD